MRRAVAISLVLAACGTLDAPPTPPLVDPGKGPFRDAGGLEMCLGSARLVARQGAAGANGVCIDPAASEVACSADEGCAHGESCICGRCVVPGCTGTQPCGEGRICRGDRCTLGCVTDADCTSGDVCAEGGCTAKCQASSECGFGGTCDKLGGVCRAATCQVDDDCAIGRTCARVQRAGDVHEPAFVSDDALLVELREGGGATETSSIYAVTRDAPRRFRLADAPLVVGAAAPSPLVRDGAIVALFAAAPDGTAIARYAATGGAATTTLVPDRPWEAGRVASPAAIDFAGATWLFYEIGDSAGIGLARLDASYAVVEKRGPIVLPSSLENPGYFRGVDHVGTPAAVVSNGVVLLYVTAHGVEGTTAYQGDLALPAPPNDSVAMAASADLVTFDLAPQNPLFARRTNLRTYLGEREPALRLGPASASILFVAADAAGNLDGVALATSP